MDIFVRSCNERFVSEMASKCLHCWADVNNFMQEIKCLYYNEITEPSVSAFVRVIIIA